MLRKLARNILLAGRLIWMAMYVGACLSMGICFALIYMITASDDTSAEWMIWVFMGVTLLLVIGGFGYETRYKRRHGYNPYSKYEKLFE